jgi:hypothetical protein
MRFQAFGSTSAKVFLLPFNLMRIMAWKAIAARERWWADRSRRRIRRGARLVSSLD